MGAAVMINTQFRFVCVCVRMSQRLNNLQLNDKFTICGGLVLSVIALHICLIKIDIVIQYRAHPHYSHLIAVHFVCLSFCSKLNSVCARVVLAYTKMCVERWCVLSSMREPPLKESTTNGVISVSIAPEFQTHIHTFRIIFLKTFVFMVVKLRV